MDSLTELFCLIDNFCHQFEPALERHLLQAGVKKRKRRSELRYIGVNDLDRFVPSVALSSVQEFLPDLRVLPLAD